MFEHLTTPINIGTMSLRNRMVQPAMGTNLAAADGTVTDTLVAYCLRRAEGGVGLIITEVCTPEAVGRCIPGELEISSTAFLPGLTRLVKAAHAGGARIALQLAHAGCFASQAVTGMQPISPSGVATALLPDDTPRAMTIEEIHNLVKIYGQAAQWAKLVGFDAVEVHGAHGYMPLQFLSGYTNRRTDEYGGSLKNRARFALEVIHAVKEHAGRDFPLIYRLSAVEDTPNGVTLADATQFAQWAQEAGVDAIHVSAGTWDSRIDTLFKVLAGQESATGKRLSEGVGTGMWVPPTYVPRGNLVPLAAAVKKVVSVPVIAVCGLSPELAEEVIARGQADLAAMGRQIIADPDYPKKVHAGKPEEIRRCLRCNECLGTVVTYRPVDCAVNPEATKEHEPFTALIPAAKPREVMVIGGGPGGMEAARVAALRGHKVTLYEKAKELGGLLCYSSVPEFKKDYRSFLAWQKLQLEQQGVRVVTGTEVTAAMVAEAKPDAVIVATGGRPAKPPVGGSDNPELLGALDILAGKIPDGKRVIVCGAGMVGAELALYLTESHGKQVVLVDQVPAVAPDVEVFTQWVLQGRLAEDGVDVRVKHCITRITPKRIVCASEGQDVSIEGDAVVLAMGMTADTTLYEELRHLPIEVIAIGDAVKARKVVNAIHEGYHAARRI